MVQEKVWVDFFAYLLTFLFGILLFAVSAVPGGRSVEIFIFFLLFCSSLGLIFQRGWARRLLRAACVGGVLYFAVKQIFFLRTVDVPSLSVMGICAILIYFYRESSMGVMYPGKDVKPNQWTVLVVDDDLTFVKLVKSHFLKQGITVISSDSGERGLEMAKRWKPDLIILDVILPGIKGRTVCAKLKEDSATENIPVVFVTFKNSLDDISAEMELGAVMHLTKPLNYDHLCAQVHKILMKG